MSSIATTPAAEWRMPDRGRVGVLCLIATEAALFSIFVVAYVFYIGKSLSPPYPTKEVLELPIIATICLLSSSITVVFAEKGLKHGSYGAFRGWLALTILLGAIFLGYTALEWNKLMNVHHLYISTNLFGTTYYSLVGLHASHVVVGLTLLLIVLGIALKGDGMKAHSRRFEFLSWYWHFVDVVWIVVFTVVYVIGRT
jgi:cytochrome c oxidase subunit 3/cytochrome o ubiquinol oxidase subunit 3